MKRFGAWVFLLVAILGGYVLFAPAEIEPVAWQAPSAPELVGTYAVNDRLAAVEYLARGSVGPEDVAIAADGRVFAGLLDGRIIQVDPESGATVVIANTAGRPLGVALLGDGNLAVADADRGLLKVHLDGQIEVLAVTANGLPFRFTDDLDVAADGAIYFSDASWKYGMEHLLADFLEHSGNGRLLRYNPADGTVDELLVGLQFANGVALGPDDAYVLVNETGAYRVTRLWLRGARAGQRDYFIENLPGFPDNISYDEQSGQFWLALYGPRSQVMDATASRPWLREMIYRLPASLHPAPAHLGFVLGLDTEGRVVANLQHHGETAYGPITSAERAGDWLYLGSLSAPSLARLPIEAAMRN